MIVAILNSLTFMRDPMRHTVYYDENCRKIETKDPYYYANIFRAVIANDIEEAKEKIRKQILRWFEKDIVWGKPDPKDFVFNIRFTEVKENGEFWLSLSKDWRWPNMTTGTSFPVG